MVYPANISGQLVAFREFTNADVEALQKVYGDSEATQYLSFEPRDRQQLESIVASAISSAMEHPRSVYMLAVVGASDGALIGAARLALGEYESAQVGFALRPDHWRSGKGLEILQLLLGFGFDDLGLHRIWGARSPLNEASARTMVKAGMVEEGRIRGHLFTRGNWRDSVVHSILADEYRSGRSHPA